MREAPGFWLRDVRKAAEKRRLLQKKRGLRERNVGEASEERERLERFMS